MRWPRWVGLLCIIALSFWSGVQWGSARGGRWRTGWPARRIHLAGRGYASGGAIEPRAAELPLPLPLPLPGEFEKQSALVVVCNELLPCFPQVFKEMVTAAHSRVPILCVVAGELEEQTVVAALAECNLPAQAVRFVRASLDTMWVRDYGPFFIQRTDGSVFVADLDYSPADQTMEVRWRDDDAPRLLAELLGLPVVAVPLRVGGGNLLSNGEGLCVTTTALLRENLDRGYDAEGVESLLRRHFGIRTWLCLRELEGERTGHADMFVAFLGPDVAVVGEMDAAVDPINAAILDEAAELLARQQTLRGPMQVYRVPMPPAEGGRWRSYTNVILANGTILVPTFSDVDPLLQDKAMGLYARLLPGWDVVGINCDGLAASDGMLHCITRNVPNFVSIADLERNAARAVEPLDESCFAPHFLPDRRRSAWPVRRVAPGGLGRGLGQVRSGSPAEPADLVDGGLWVPPEGQPETQDPQRLRSTPTAP